VATKHFTDDELRCRCGCGGLPSVEFQEALEQLRVQYGHPMRLSSAHRCQEHNDKVSSTGRNGPHTKGAVDVLVWGPDAYELISDAILLDWSGIGVSQKGPKGARFIHLDDTDGPTRPWVWSY